MERRVNGKVVIGDGFGVFEVFPRVDQSLLLHCNPLFVADLFLDPGDGITGRHRDATGLSVDALHKDGEGPWACVVGHLSDLKYEKLKAKMGPFDDVSVPIVIGLTLLTGAAGATAYMFGCVADRQFDTTKRSLSVLGATTGFSVAITSFMMTLCALRPQ